MKLLSLLQNAEMADVMRSEGKIYVVVAGLLIVVAGFLAYLFFLDRKVSKLEKEVENNKRV
ncbi:MAG: CcmD family protein [Leadbetterella sp.]|nr:CcmD family protein [Leadbetterella sp.]